MRPFFNNFIKVEINNKKNILVVAHGNSLRALMIEVGLYKPEEISSIEIPTGKPFIINYKLDRVIGSEYLS